MGLQSPHPQFESGRRLQQTQAAPGISPGAAPLSRSVASWCMGTHARYSVAPDGRHVYMRAPEVHGDAFPLLHGTAQKRRHDRDDERPEERRAKAINEHAGVRDVAGEVACQLEHERVDDEREQAKRDDRERQAQDLEDGLHRRVDEREEQGREDGARVRPAHDLDARDEPDGRSHRDGPDEPPSKKSHASPFDVLVEVYPRAAGGARGTLATGSRANPAARLPRNPL